jgi:hypothetical protein
LSFEGVEKLLDIIIDLPIDAYSNFSSKNSKLLKIKKI